MHCERIKNTILYHKMIRPGDLVVVAVSGGPDSVALLHLLNDLRGRLGFSIHVAHLDHMLRKESHKDAEFVRQLSRRLNLPITIRQINVSVLVKNDSLEQTARRLRLEFLCSVARTVKTRCIALGHTKDDQAETILMRLIRGTGLYGLRGILPIREIDGFIFIRPLIELTRADIERYLKKHKIKSRFDRTNVDMNFFRNRVRHKLIPLLEKSFNPKIKEALYNLSRVIQKDYDYLYRLSNQQFKRLQVKKHGNKIRIDLDKLKRQHPSIQRMLVRLAVEKLIGDTRRLTYKHWEELEDLIYHRQNKSIVDLPRQIKVVKLNDGLIISVRKT
jgi:tRNA(Ile)-lysidine synthase